jgi:hypothetical protein
VFAELRAALAAQSRPRPRTVSTTRGPRATQRRLALLAELSQLTGWVAADAGAPAVAYRAYRFALSAASAGGDRPFQGHVLGALAQLTSAPGIALRLADAGHELAAPSASATTRVLLLHRVAHAAARAGERRHCDRALADAEAWYARRDPDGDPAWTYWLDDTALTLLTGRCHAVLGRHREAVPLLQRGLAGLDHPRSAAVYGGWLAEAHLGAGDLEPAADRAARMLLDAVRAGSLRASTRARAVHARLSPMRDAPAAGRYLRLATTTARYLPIPIASGPGDAPGYRAWPASLSGAG